MRLSAPRPARWSDVDARLEIDQRLRRHQEVRRGRHARREHVAVTRRAHRYTEARKRPVHGRRVLVLRRPFFERQDVEMIEQHRRRVGRPNSCGTFVTSVELKFAASVKSKRPAAAVSSG